MIALMKKLRRVKEPKAVDPFTAYRDAIASHDARHEELRRAAAGVMFARIKLEGDVLELRAEIARFHADIRAYVRGGNERHALLLIEEKRRLSAELVDRERELSSMKNEADEASAEVMASASTRRNLEREKLRAIATLTVARARKNMAELREREAQPTHELEQVREQIARIAGESSLDRELGGDVLVRELGPGFGDEGARAELAAIRKAVGR
jgi:phage shock protein A